MTDLQGRLVASLEESADLLEEWIGETRLPKGLQEQGGTLVNALRTIAVVVSTV